MPSFDYQKKKKKILEEKKINKLKGPIVQNVKTETYFFTEINVFVITQSKVPKKGTGTKFQVAILVPYQLKCERYPTPVFIRPLRRRLKCGI